MFVNNYSWPMRIADGNLRFMNGLLVTSVDPKQLNAAEIPAVVVSNETPVPGSHPDPIEAIRVRAETVSLILKDMMDRHPVRHWGINE